MLLSLFIIFQFGFFDNEVLANGFIKLIGPWFIISCIMNIGWIFSWHYEEMGISMLIMIGLLLSLIMITTRLTPWNIENATGLTDLTVLAKLSMYAFDIYIGWITAATIANASVFLIDINWDQFGLSDQFWTVIVLIAGALLGILFVVSNRRYLSAAALIWAYCGILIKHISQIGYGGRYPTIIAVTTIGIVAILSTIVIELILNMEAVS